MNERIQKLAEQSYKEVIETNDYNGSAYTVREFVQEKFAELIIRECAKCGSKAMYPDSDPDYVGRKIREHFGVKE